MVLGKCGPQKYSEQRTPEHADEHYAAYGNGTHGMELLLLRVTGLFVMPNLDGWRKAITHEPGADCL